MTGGNTRMEAILEGKQEARLEVILEAKHEA